MTQCDSIMQNLSISLHFVFMLLLRLQGGSALLHQSSTSQGVLLASLNLAEVGACQLGQKTRRGA